MIAQIFSDFCRRKKKSTVQLQTISYNLAMKQGEIFTYLQVRNYSLFPAERDVKRKN